MSNYYRPNEVIFREGFHNHNTANYNEGEEEYPLSNFFSANGDCPDRDPHTLYFLDTKLTGESDYNTSFDMNETTAQQSEVVVLFKGQKPVSVDYKYVVNAPKVAIDDYGLKFDKLFSKYTP